MSVPVDRRYLVAGCKPWNRRAFMEAIRLLPGEWHFVGSREALTAALVQRLSPRFVFFLHWSWKVPPEIVDHHECVNFHMTDLPYGRGGSPLQNLILRGHTVTRLTAHRMTNELDAGPIYLKEELSLDGTAQDILVRASALSVQMIERIVREEPIPAQQRGDAVVFERRTARQSAIPELPSLEALYDYIRMLDGEGYPHAFIDFAGFRLEFTNAVIGEEQLTADVTIARPRGSDQ